MNRNPGKTVNATSTHWRGSTLTISGFGAGAAYSYGSAKGEEGTVYSLLIESYSVARASMYWPGGLGIKEAYAG